MIISRTPYRVSFFGGGTDYPAWFREHGGAVLAATINHYCYITCRFLPPFFDHASRIVWSKIELVNDSSEIEHPAIRAAVDLLEIGDGVELHHNGDLPARSGLGSSSAFAVGLLHALYALRGDEVSKKDLAARAIYLEQDLLGENVGVQDQIETAFGGLNRIEIRPDGSFDVQPLELSEARLAELENHILMFYTGVARNASDIAAAQVRAIPSHKADLHEMRRLVDYAAAVLTGGDLADFGRLLDETWQIKRRLSDQIAPEFVNDIYDRARRAGALGGKLLGAGGGGFMLFIVRPEDHAKVLTELHELLVVPVEFDWTGTQLLFNAPPRYSRTAHQRRDYTRYIVGEDGAGAGDGASAASHWPPIQLPPGAPSRTIANGSAWPIEDSSPANRAAWTRARSMKTISDVSRSSDIGAARKLSPTAWKK
jgi:D-glycero-alpha-D-manno-heptose-7-phosphate kinase